MKPRSLKPRRSNGPPYLSPSRFKPLGFLWRNRHFLFSQSRVGSVGQLDWRPSYPSKSQEERGRPELLEKKRKKRLSGLDRCEKRYLSLILFLILPFLQVTLVVGSPLTELPMPPDSNKTCQDSMSPRNDIAAPLPLPAGRNLSFICFISS